jgi:predicted amidohydrolase
LKVKTRFVRRSEQRCSAPASIGLCDNQATTVRVASISFEPVKFDLAENTKTLDAWFRKAAKGSAKIAVTPEGALEGYVVDGIIAEDVDAERMREVCFSSRLSHQLS